MKILIEKLTSKMCQTLAVKKIKDYVTNIHTNIYTWRFFHDFYVFLIYNYKFIKK